MGGLKFGVNRPTDTAVLLWANHLTDSNNHASVSPWTLARAVPRSGFPPLSPEPQLVLGLQPTGEPSRRDKPRSPCFHPIIPNYIITKWAGSVLCLPQSELATRGHSSKIPFSKLPCPPLGVEARLVSFLEWARREEQAEGRKPVCS